MKMVQFLTYGVTLIYLETFAAYATEFERLSKMTEVTSAKLMEMWDNMASTFPTLNDSFVESDFYKIELFDWNLEDDRDDITGILDMSAVSLSFRIPTQDWKMSTTKGKVLASSPKDLKKLFDSASGEQFAIIASDVFSVTLFDDNGNKLKYEDKTNPAEIEMRLKEYYTSNQVECGFWDTNDGNWSFDGCYRSDKSNDAILVCECTHLTTFAGLFQLNPTTTVYPKSLKIVTTVLMIVSIIALILGISVLLYLWKRSPQRKDMTLININLEISLLLTLVLMLIGGHATLKKGGCLAVTILQHYTLVAMFTWMLIAAVDFYRMIVSLGGKKKHRAPYMAVGWGVPLVIAFVTASVGGMDLNKRSSTTMLSCWLSGSYVWAFLGPVILLISANIFTLGLVMFKTVKATASREKDNLKLIRAGVKCLLLLLPLFGVTWLLGFLTINLHIVVSYIFDVVSALQGVYMVVVICWVNSEVREMLKREWNKRSGRIKHVSTYNEESQKTSVTMATNM